MGMTERHVCDVFYRNRDRLLDVAKNRMQSNMGRVHEDYNIKTKVMADEIVAEELVDDLLINTIQSKAFKRGFTSEENLEKYLFVSIRRNISAWYKIHYLKLIPPLTDKERMGQLKLAVEIINTLRPVDS